MHLAPLRAAQGRRQDDRYTTPEHATRAPGPIEPYTNQPYTRASPAPTPPPQTTVEQSIENELAKPDNSLLRDWLNYQLGSPGEEDPLGIELPNPDIEFIELDRRFRDHGHKFSPGYTDKRKYWRDAADIVRPKRLGDVKDGKIVTYYPPDRGFDDFVEQCDE